MKPYYDEGGITIYHAPWQEVLPTLGDESVDLIVTDPPYGIDLGVHEKWHKVAGDKVIDLEWLPGAFRVLRYNAACYVATRWDVYPEWKAGMEQIFHVRDCIVWDKMRGGQGDTSGSGYAPRHEFWIYATKDGDDPHERHKLRGKRLDNLWPIPRGHSGDYEHPTQKPVAVPQQCVAKSSDAGDLVLDLFMGSGSALRAAKDLGRRAIGCEVEEQYCEVAARKLGQESLFMEVGE